MAKKAETKPRKRAAQDVLNGPSALPRDEQTAPSTPHAKRKKGKAKR